MNLVLKAAAVIALNLSFLSCKNSADQSKEESVGGSSIIFSGFSDEELSPGEYVQWMQNPENGMKKKKVIDDILFSVQYKPIDYIICMEEKSETIKKEELKKKRSELEDMEYYDIEIALNSAEGELLRYNLSSSSEYDERIRYFSFDMQRDVQLVENGDTILCGMFHFERAYNAVPFCKFLVGFPKNKKIKESSERTVVLRDKIFEKGIIKFTFSKNELNTIPTLKTI